MIICLILFLSSMFSRATGSVAAFAVFVWFCSHALAQYPPPIPTAPIHLGIQRDDFTGVQSYSGWISFKEDTINEAGQYPPQYMSDEKLLKLTVIAYNEMLTIFDSQPLRSSDRCAAMIVMARGKYIFWASSMKGKYDAYYAGVTSPEFNQIISNCQTVSDRVHRIGLACGEPNVLDFYFSCGVTTDDRPRMAAWLTLGLRGDEKNYKACSRDARGYGCESIVENAQADTFKNKTPDPGDGSEWLDKYIVEVNLRDTCP